MTSLRELICPLKKKTMCALPGVAHLVGHRPTKQKVTGSIPSHSTSLSFKFSPWPGYLGEATKMQPMEWQQTNVSLPSFTLPFSLSKNKSIIFFFKGQVFL